MTTLFRPIVSGFDASRPTAPAPRSSGGYHSFGNIAIEGLIAREVTRLIRPTRLTSTFAEFCTR